MAGAFIARECGLLVPELEAGRGRGHGGGGGGEQETVEHGGALAGERRLGGGHGEISASPETGARQGRGQLYTDNRMRLRGNPTISSVIRTVYRTDYMEISRDNTEESTTQTTAYLSVLPKKMKNVVWFVLNLINFKDEPQAQSVYKLGFRVLVKKST